MRVGVVGPPATDTLSVDGGEPVTRAGGAPVYAARALRFAGAEPVTVESPGRFVTRLHQGPEGTRQVILQAAEPLTVEHVEVLAESLADCRWVLLGAQTAGDFPPETIAALAQRGFALCLDGQGLARGGEPGPVRLRAFPDTAVAGVTALKLNEAEAAPLGLDQRRPAFGGVPELLITRGERGALVATADRVVEVVTGGDRFPDPTGAGDSFAALYCLGRARGLEAAEAARLAVEMVDRLYSS
ncbi:MAG: PfkB family carbohydrate kinase [Gaiellales bacterium]